LNSQKPVQDLNERVRFLEAELEATRKKLAGSEIELEAHEALLKMSVNDTRRIFEDLMRSQTQLLQADKMATIGILSAGIVHEINNPLAAVKLVVSLMMSQIENLRKLLVEAGQNREKIESILSESEGHLVQGEECVDHITRIVRDIKVFSRSDKGGFQPEDLNRVLDSVVGIVWNSIKTKVILKKEYATLPPVPCNPQQMSQVFLNLIVNASQAMDRGTITLRTCMNDGFAQVEISDTGSGIPPEILNKIFEPFFTTKDDDKGTGLGLSITHDIVERHKGTIDVQSKVGEGTTFKIRLPLN
jgi:two-component system, NtrC family, sensor kinase